jgi:hypothetical protein
MHDRVRSLSKPAPEGRAFINGECPRAGLLRFVGPRGYDGGSHKDRDRVVIPGSEKTLDREQLPGDVYRAWKRAAANTLLPVLLQRPTMIMRNAGVQSGRQAIHTSDQ